MFARTLTLLALVATLCPTVVFADMPGLDLITSNHRRVTWDDWDTASDEIEGCLIGQSGIECLEWNRSPQVHAFGIGVRHNASYTVDWVKVFAKVPGGDWQVILRDDIDIISDAGEGILWQFSWGFIMDQLGHDGDDFNEVKLKVQIRSTGVGNGTKDGWSHLLIWHNGSEMFLRKNDNGTDLPWCGQYCSPGERNTLQLKTSGTVNDVRLEMTNITDGGGW